MQLRIFKDYPALSDAVASEIVELAKSNPEAVFCFASGDTPRMAFTMLAAKAREEQVSFDRCTFIGLDEWVGIPPENEGSCHSFLHTTVFKSLHISPNKIHLFNAMSNELFKQCETMDKLIRDIGGIDLMVVGIGMNGHIGFNEPGIPFDKYSHVANLDETTQSVGQKYFKQNSSLKQGITVGLQHLMEAREVILMANGAKKAPIIKKAVEGEVNNDVPASIMQLHEQGWVMVDEEAASLLED